MTGFFVQQHIERRLGAFGPNVRTIANAWKTRYCLYRADRAIEMAEAESGIAAVLPYLAMGTVVTANVVGSVFMKIGATVPERNAFLFGMFGWQTIAGIAFFASGALFYALALKGLPLNVAQSIAALQFVGTVGAAVVVLGEAVTLNQWFGIALICMGLFLVVR